VFVYHRYRMCDSNDDNYSHIHDTNSFVDFTETHTQGPINTPTNVIVAELLETVRVQAQEINEKNQYIAEILKIEKSPSQVNAPMNIASMTPMARDISLVKPAVVSHMNTEIKHEKPQFPLLTQLPPPLILIPDSSPLPPLSPLPLPEMW